MSNMQGEPEKEPRKLWPTFVCLGVASYVLNFILLFVMMITGANPDAATYTYVSPLIDSLLTVTIISSIAAFVLVSKQCQPEDTPGKLWIVSVCIGFFPMCSTSCLGI